MQKLPKILVVLAVIAASLYFVHRVDESSLAGVQAPADQARPGSEPAPVPASAPASVPGLPAQAQGLVYPDAKAAQALALGYEVFKAQGDGSFMVLPLPPGVALRTTLSLSARQPGLSVEMTDAQCASPVELAAYRADRQEPVATHTLAANAKAGPVRLDLSGAGGNGQPVILTFAMAAQAQNNWHCNLALKWVE